MIRFVHGNLFDSKAEALVNTVNCVGVMGKGIAYQFKRAYPKMFADYVARCRRHEIRPGKVTTFRENGKLIINFPTKEHWKASSRLEDVEAGLTALRDLMVGENITSIAVPPLGCGNGGLDWPTVKAAIIAALESLETTDIEVYEPIGHFESKITAAPRVSLSHFVLAAIRVALERPTKLNIQKTAYFFNVFAQSNYFQFTEHKFGPYCVAIDPMFQTIRDYLEYGGMSPEQMVEDGLKRKLSGTDADRLRNWSSAIAAAARFSNSMGENLEAVATVHAIVHKQGSLSRDELVSEFMQWSPEKAQRFTSDDVWQAVDLLEQHGMVRRTLLGVEALGSAALSGGKSVPQSSAKDRRPPRAARSVGR
jgi:O-acetyl-ADP-ribose deacetylase (regulator of RNase III)